MISKTIGFRGLAYFQTHPNGRIRSQTAAPNEAIFFLILVRHVPHKNDDRYHVSRVWARVKYGEDVDRPLAARHHLASGHGISWQKLAGRWNRILVSRLSHLRKRCTGVLIDVCLIFEAHKIPYFHHVSSVRFVVADGFPPEFGSTASQKPRAQS